MATFVVTTLADETFEGTEATAADGTGLSLREALGLANTNGSGSDTITFASSGTIVLTNGQLVISTDVVIDGDANGTSVTVDGDGQTRVFHVTGGTSTLDSLTITGGFIPIGALDGGGGVRINQEAGLTISNSTLIGNRGSFGGAVFAIGNNTTIIGSTLSDNYAYRGGALSTMAGSTLVINSTLSGNQVVEDGGAIHAGSISSAIVVNSTLSGNRAGRFGGGAFSDNPSTSGGGPDDLGAGASSRILLHNSIVAGNQAEGAAATSDLAGDHPVFSGVNVVGVGAGAALGDNLVHASTLGDLFANVGINTTTGVLSGLLADNGGPLQTIAIRPGGVAQDAGDDNVQPPDLIDVTIPPFPLDERGLPRVVGAHIDIGAVESAEPLLVTTVQDEAFDGGDLAAETADGGGLSLREALALANAADSPRTIEFAGGLVGPLVLTNGELVASGRVIVDGDANGSGVTIDAAGASRVFDVTGGQSTLEGLTITGGNAAAGGGVRVTGGATLTIRDSTLSGNHAVLGGGLAVYAGAVRVESTTVADNSATLGGGISTTVAASLTVLNSTLSGNQATSQGGGLWNFGHAALVNTSVAGNQAADRGGGILNAVGTLALTNSTLSGNAAGTSGGGLDNASTATLTNSIVAGNGAPAQPDVGGTAAVAYAGLNIVGVGGDSNAADHVVNAPSLAALFREVGANPMTGVQSGVLGDNGGPVATIAIRAAGVADDPAGTTPAADAADVDGDGVTAEPLPVDARGLNRAAGAGMDVGAFEVQAVPQVLVVTTLADETYDGGEFVQETADGYLSLREAIGLANADGDANRIEFAVDGAIVLTNGQLVISSNLVIDGDAGITIDGAGLSRVLLATAGTARLEELTITGGAVAGVGGGVLVGGGASLAISRSTLAGNSAGNGGALGNYGTLSLSETTVAGNQAAFAGGAIVNAATGTLRLVNTTLSGNDANYAGGIVNYGNATMANTTLAGNSAVEQGGAVLNAGGTLTLQNSSLSGNQAGSAGGGLYSALGSTAVTNSIVAGNAAPTGPEVAGAAAVAYGGVNVIGVGADGNPADHVINAPSLGALFAAVGANPDTGVVSGVLGDNGGSVATIATMAGGVAQDAGDNAALPADILDIDADGDVAEQLPLDARGFDRTSGLRVDIGAFEFRAAPATMVVTTLADETYDGGDFLQETADGHLSLREAIGLANATADLTRITFAVDGTLALAHGELMASNDLVIDGDGRIALDGGGLSRVLNVTGGSARLEGLTITGGAVASVGGGVLVGGGATLAISHSTLAGNSAGNGGALGNYGILSLSETTVAGNQATFAGGAIVNAATGTLRLVSTTLSGNDATYAGAIVNYGSATMANATLAGNSAAEQGGAVLNAGGTLTLQNSTLSGNQAGSAGGGLYSALGSTAVTNSIVAGNAAPTGPDVAGAAAVAYGGVNVIGVGADSNPADHLINAPTLGSLFDAVAANPHTGAVSGVLANNGGSVATIATNPGGVAQDAGDNAGLPADVLDIDGDGDVAEQLPLDARGFDRTADPRVDVGAFELRAAPAAMVVTTLADEAYDGGDFAAETADGHLSLREAIGLANRDSNPNDIAFVADLDGTIVLTGGELAILSSVAIDGAANGSSIAIDAHDASRIFDFSGGRSTVSGMALTGGRSDNFGGAVFVGGGAALTIARSTISDSQAKIGGGIFIDRFGELTLVSSTVSENSSSFEDGGGIENRGTALVIGSTFSGNHAALWGGGLDNYSGARATVINSTFSGNSANTGGGIKDWGGSAGLTIVNSTLSGNLADDLGGGLHSDNLDGIAIANTIMVGNFAYTFFRDSFYYGRGGPGTLDGDALTDQPDIDEVFATLGTNPYTGIVSGVLADNGGPVQTIAIKSGGLAQGAGRNDFLPADTLDLDGDGNVTEPIQVDARGLSRISGEKVDSGAVELQTSAARPDIFVTPENAPCSGSVFADNGHGPDTPTADQALAVAAVNGSGGVGIALVLPSGAMLTVNPDGTFSYDPNGAFDSLPDFVASGAANTTVVDSFSYTLVGGSVATVMVSVRGVDSDDRLRGTAGDDTLNGGIGNDRINGRGGADDMLGGLGDDTYFVDHDGDLVIEEVGEGRDTVRTGIDYTVAAGREIETLRVQGTAAGLTLTGNDRAMRLIGGSGGDILAGGASNDRINGRGGADEMLGGAGDDTYYVDQAGDRVIEGVGEGMDVVRTSVDFTIAPGDEIEELRAFGTTAGLTLVGNDLANVLIGGSGADLLIGGAGGDHLRGGAGSDRFQYAIGGGSDRFSDFDGAAGDRVDLLGVTIQSLVNNIATLSNGETLTAQKGYQWMASDFDLFP
ncbi:MAG: hypothetical protein KIS73_25665 [Enhydrobacter sp.]|nr:hypothetical protein [Enhydrobacter sp.]